MDTSNLPRLNARQAEFVKAIAAGETLVGARRIAYPRTNNWPPKDQWRNAVTTAQSRRVSAWLDALKEATMADLKITRETLLERLETTRKAAHDDKQHGAAVSAIKEQGTLLGFRVEAKRDDDDLSPDRLRARLAKVEKDLAQYEGKAHLRVASGAGKGEKSA